MVQVQEDRPPFVSFEVRAVEDRDASLAAGHYVAKDVDYALVTPRGSRDRVERVAEEWLANLRKDSANGRFPLEWLRTIETGYKDWKEGRESPVNGTAISNWPVLSPAQLVLMRQIGVRSIEDLAAANEEMITRLGMGGRALKQQAADWLSSSQDLGKVSQEMGVLRVENETLKAQNKTLQDDLQTLAANVRELQAAKGQAKV